MCTLASTRQTRRHSPNTFTRLARLADILQALCEDTPDSPTFAKGHFWEKCDSPFLVSSFARSLARSFVCVSRKFHLKKFHFFDTSVCGEKLKIVVFRLLAHAVMRYAVARSHTRMHAQCQLFIFYQIWGKWFLSKKNIWVKSPKKIWHFEHKRLKDSAAVGAWSYRWGMQNLTKHGIKDDTPLFEKSHHGILDLLVFY
jgi:hypothetical protein